MTKSTGLCKNARCLNEKNFELSESEIKSFAKETNLDEYVICQHEKRIFCEYGVPFADIVMCRCKQIVDIVNENNK